MGHHKMTVEFRHYCTFDRKVNLPAKFLKIYNIKEFKTHDFISAVQINVNSKLVFSGIIKKEDFRSLLNDELNKYAVLISPNITLTNNSLAIQYSASVPLTDVGKGVVMKIDALGNKHISDDL
jgi:aspartate carbamoyltransferase regulatory subunit